jgi:hypothetical protein
LNGFSIQPCLKGGDKEMIDEEEEGDEEEEEWEEEEW